VHVVVIAVPNEYWWGFGMTYLRFGGAGSYWGGGGACSNCSIGHQDGIKVLDAALRHNLACRKTFEVDLLAESNAACACHHR
jgi:hypothetical protein